MYLLAATNTSEYSHVAQVTKSLHEHLITDEIVAKISATNP